MNPSYRVQIDVCLKHPREEDDVWLRHIRWLPFVPRSGDTLRLTDEMDENTIDLTLESVVYDVTGGVFIAEITDETPTEFFRDAGVCNAAESIAMYKPFDFQRLNFPTAQVVRDE